MADQSDVKAVILRLPTDVVEWLRHQAERNYSNRNTEVVRVIRDRMDAQREKVEAR